MKNRLFFYIALVCWQIFLCEAFSEAPPESEHHEGAAFEVYEESFENAKKIKPIRFKGFGGYRTRFQRMCSYLEEDGHKEWLAERSKELSRSREICAQCRSLYVVLNSVCAGKKKTKKKIATPVVVEDTESPQPTPTVVSIESLKLEPQTELIDLVSRMFRQMAEDREAAEDNYKAVKHLIGELLSTPGRDSSEIAYFQILTAYIKAPFTARSIGHKPIDPDTQGGESPKIEESTDWLDDKL